MKRQSQTGFPKAHFIPYAGTATALIGAIESKAISVAAGFGQTIVAADVTVETVQGA